MVCNSASSVHHGIQEYGSGFPESAGSSDQVQEVVDELMRKWPVMIVLFATSLSYRLHVYFSPLNEPMAAGTDALLQSWDGLQAYAFPQFSSIRGVLNKLRSSKEEWFPELQELAVVPPVILRPDRLKQPHVHRFHQHLHVLQLRAWRQSSDLRDI